MRSNFVILSVFILSNVIAQKGPQPGDIYREYAVNLKSGDNWRVTDPNASHSGAAQFLPNPVLSVNIDDLEGAVRAEVLMDIWGGHPGTTGRQFRFNDSTWIDIPLPTSLQGISECYLFQNNVILNVPLEYLKEGSNTFQGTSRGQVCGDFGWGQWGWYVMIVRIYYSDDKMHTKGRIMYPLTGNTLNDNPDIIIETEDTATVTEINVIGHYTGYDEDGDGVYTDWHRAYHTPSITGHIGTRTKLPYQFRWDTRFIPDQKERSVKLMARIKNTSGIWYVTETVDSLSLIRPDSLSVKMYKAQKVPRNFSVRGGNSKYCLVKIDTFEHAMEARLSHRTWNAADDEAASGTIKKPLSINDHGYKCGGSNHFFSLSNVPVAVGDLNHEINTIRYSSNTVHHGIEVLWPGPAIIIRYVRGGEKVADPVFSPADGFIFEEPFFPEITTETEDALIYYSTDGTDPHTGDLRFRNSLEVDDDITVKARAFKTDYYESEVVTVEYFNNSAAHIQPEDEIVRIFPNPAGDEIFIDISMETQAGQFEILNTLGKVTKSGVVSGNKIPANDLPNGLYILIYKGKNTYITKKLIISR